MQKVSLAFPLRHPESVEWQHDQRFNVHAHTRLLAARTSIIHSTPAADRRPQAEADLLQVRTFPMSQRQEMLLYYLLAQCARARDFSQSTHFGQMLEWCARAEQIAGALLDFGAQVDLHELRGTVHRAMSMYWIAAEEFSYALRLLREHAEDTESFDPEFEVTLAAKTASLDYLLGNFSRSLEHIRRAETLLPLTTMSIAGRGTIAWTRALLHRQRNELVEALWHVEEASVLYRHLGATNSTCRVLSLAADIALDMAESAAGEMHTGCQKYLTLGGRYIEEALRVGREAEDQPGIEVAALSLARLERIQGTAGVLTPEARIREVMRQARKMRDDSLLVAAQTALGVDVLECGEHAAGRRWLRRAIATAARINAPGLAFRAERILRQADGRNT